MTERLFDVILTLWQSLQGIVEPVLDFLSTSITIGSNSYSVMTLFFGGAIGLFLVYTIAIWIGNIVT